MKILCINLDSDTESWRLSQQEFARVGLTVERLSATVGDNRPLAFNKSVYRAMEMAKGDDLLLMEDDIVFDEPPEMPMPPEGWLSIHAGANIIGTDQMVWQMPTRLNDHYARLWNAWQSHCTFYSAECVDLILEKMNPNILTVDQMIFDEWFRVNIMPMGRSYLRVPMIAYQRPRHSSIWNTPSDYTGCHRQGNHWLKMNL